MQNCSLSLSMAATSKLNNNLSLLSWKRTHNLRGSPCRYKSLQFGGANSIFSGFKAGIFRLNSTSNSRINNNVALSFHSGEVESVNLNSLSCSTNKKNASYPFEGVKEALDMLKSKVPSLVMASCLMLGMMMINCHKPAFAFPGTTLFSSPAAAASSSSRSTARGCPLCSNGCIFCLEMPTTNTRGRRAQTPTFLHVLAIVLPVFAVIIGFCLMILVRALISCFTSIFKIQVGLLVDDELQRDLSLISKALEGCTSSAWKTILDDIVEVLDWHRSKWIFGYSSGKIVCKIVRCSDHFENLSYEETKKFDKGRPVNLRNSHTKKIANGMLKNTEFKNKKFMVVTLLVAINGWHKLPTISKWGDLDRVLKKLKSRNAKTQLEGVNVLWVPQKDGEILTFEQLKNNHPLLRPLIATNDPLAFNNLINFFGCSTIWLIGFYFLFNYG